MCLPHENEEGFEKVWACLFVCFHSRAIHIELVKDSTTLQFIYALRRFVGRRGKPAIIYTDNASYFKKADVELRQLHRKIDFDAIRRAGNVGGQLSQQGAPQLSPITWDFSTEKAPWTNAITERLVQSVKKSLRPTVLRGVLTFEQLEVLLIEIEGIINCRPLGIQQTNDPEDLIPVTPSLLMYGKNMMPIEDPPRALRQDEVDQPAFAKRFQLRKQLLDTFWRKWKKEYLARYQVNRTWRQKHENIIRVGDVVVIIDPDNMKKNDWKLGRVVEPTFFATTGDLSGAKCRLANGQVVTRHLRQIALLEANTAFRGKLIAEKSPTSHDDPSVTVTRLDKSPEIRPQSTSTERPIPNESPSHDADRHDSVTGRPSVKQTGTKIKKVKVQSASQGESTIVDFRRDKSPDNATPILRTGMVNTTSPAKIVPNVRDEVSEESTSHSVRRGEPCLARPPQYDPRRTGEGADPAQVSVPGGGGIYRFETGENDSGEPAGDVSRSELSTQINLRHSKGHRAKRLHAGKRKRK